MPLVAIALAMFAAFPAFADLRAELQRLIFESFLPNAGEAAGEHFTRFVENATQLTAPGILGLAVTAVLLLANIDGALNAVWRVAEGRALATQLLVYWALLTLGPLLVGSSISLSGYVFAAVRIFGVEHALGGLAGVSRGLSVVLAALGFGVMYFIVPNRRIHPAHALAGGITAAVLFEILKAAFGLYVAHFPSYRAVYGAMAAVPLFLVWLYLSWLAVLFGAEVAAALPEWRAVRARGHRLAGPGGRLALALSVLGRLRTASREGRQPRRAELLRGLPATPVEVDDVMKTLRRAGFVARTAGARWVLARDLAAASLGDLEKALGLGLDLGQGWPPFASAAVGELIEADRAIRGRSLEEVLAEAVAEAHR